MPFCRVAVDSRVFALDRPFDYSVPERMEGHLEVGSVVRVGLHGRNVRAFVTELPDEPAVASPRPVSRLVSPRPVFDPETIEFARWVARRYVAPLGAVLHDAVPGRFSLPDEKNRSPGKPMSLADAPRPRWLPEGLASVMEPHGSAWVAPPTEAAQEEVLAHAVALVSETGRQSLVLCPRVEVAERLARRLEDVAVMHGEESPATRARGWTQAREGEVAVVVGGRSAVFVPFRRLGLVAVASAHDRSFKSERAPRIHALRAAQERAHQAKAAFLVSSPAPPLDIFAQAGIATLPSGRSPVRPEVGRPRGGPITPRLLEMVGAAMQQGRDALVFVGRKGDVLRLRCRDCGWAPACPSCGRGSVPHGSSLECRVCGEVNPAPEVCASCGGELGSRGWGHERVASAIEAHGIGPVVRIAGGQLPSSRPRPAVVVGTLAAAHAVEDAGCVCVADLDQLLVRPDFRASEHALQVLHDLAGVLGPEGRFLVQTREPEHYVVQSFTRGSYEYFMTRELPFRRETSYPPYGVVVKVEGPADRVEELPALLGHRARVLIAPGPRGRSTGLLRSMELEELLDPLHELAQSEPKLRIDVDPVDVL